MTLHFFQPTESENKEKGRYYLSQFDGDNYQIVDAVENREFCVCSNYDDWEDALERATKIVALLNESELKKKE